MILIKCEINLFLTWYAKRIIVTETVDNQILMFTTTDTKIHVLVMTLAAQNNGKLLQQLKTGFKKTINWNNYQSDPTLQTRIGCLNHLVDSSFQVVNRLFVSSFGNHAHETSYKKRFFPIVKTHYYNVMIDEKIFLYQLIKNN